MAHTLSLPDCSIELADFLISVVPLTEAQELEGMLWAAENWVEAPLSVLIEQQGSSCLVTPLPLHQQAGFSNIQVFNWQSRPEMVQHPQGISSVGEAVAQFHIATGLAELPAGSHEVAEFRWGQLLELCWHKAGFAPGGSEYYLFPAGIRPIHFGGLRANWEQLHVFPATA